MATIVLALWKENEHSLRHKDSFINNVILAKINSIPAAGGQLKFNLSFGTEIAIFGRGSLVLSLWNF